MSDGDLFGDLILSAFDHLAGASPVVVAVGREGPEGPERQDEQDRPDRPRGRLGPQEPRDADLAASGLLLPGGLLHLARQMVGIDAWPGQVSRELRQGPVLGLPPWGRLPLNASPGPFRQVHERLVSQLLAPESANPLGLLLPSSSLTAISSDKRAVLRRALDRVVVFPHPAGRTSSHLDWPQREAVLNERLHLQWN